MPCAPCFLPTCPIDHVCLTRLDPETVLRGARLIELVRGLGNPMRIVVGGVLQYGIPSFRLPREIISREVQQLKDMGVKIETNKVIGKTFTIDQASTTTTVVPGAHASSTGTGSRAGRCGATGSACCR